MSWLSNLPPWLMKTSREKAFFTNLSSSGTTFMEPVLYYDVLLLSNTPQGQTIFCEWPTLIYISKMQYLPQPT